MYLLDIECDVTTSKYRFCNFCPGGACLKQFSENIFISVRPIRIQTKVHFKSAQFLVVMFEMKG